MPSQTLLLAVSIPMAVLLFLVLTASAFFIIRTRATALAKQNWQNCQIAELQKKLKATPQLKIYGVFHPTLEGVPHDEIERAYFQLKSSVCRFLDTWVGKAYWYPISESEERIKNILFGEVDGEDRVNSPNQNNIFPNPHRYTALEISDAISGGRGRQLAMFKYIIFSTILPAVLLNAKANPEVSLLPFHTRDLPSIIKLFEMIRGQNLSYGVRLFLSKYALYEAVDVSMYGAESRPGSPWAHSNRKIYIEFIDALLSPHFDTQNNQPTNDKTRARHEEIHGILENAVLFGMKVIGYAEDGEVAIQWGPRLDAGPTASPGLWRMHFSPDGKIVWKDPEGGMDECSQWTRAQMNGPYASPILRSSDADA